MRVPDRRQLIRQIISAADDVSGEESKNGPCRAALRCGASRRIVRRRSSA